MNHFRDKLRTEGAHLHERSRRGIFHLLFGRSTLIFLLLLVQVVLLIGLVLRWQNWSYAYGGTYVLSAAMAVHLINKPMTSGSRQTWLILILLAPVLGTVLYLYVETDIGHRLVRTRLEQIEKKDRRMDEKDELIRRLMDKCL